MHNQKSRKIYSMFFLVLITGILLTLFSTIYVYAAATGTHTPVTGVTVDVSGATDNSMTNGKVTVTAKGSGGIFGFGAYNQEATIQITNNLSKSAQLSFDWTATSVYKLVIGPTTYATTTGSYSDTLDAGASLYITIRTAKNGTTNKLEMSNFSITEVADKSEITVLTGNGSTISVDGESVHSGSSVSVTNAGATVTANSANFVAWIDTANNAILSENASFLYQPIQNTTIKAVYGPNACFKVGNKLFESLTAAATESTNSSYKTIILANNGTLPSGNYTIPSGVTLLIPFDSANTLYTQKPGTATYDSEAAFVKTTPYRTMTMANGANISVNGAISVSGKVSASMPLNGLATGPAGFIKMNTGSSITINSNANLYVWGYIQGSGMVTIKNGGTVYECFQVRDFRGGTATSGMVKNDEEVFPMSQYYIQNVEAPMKLEAGAKEKGFFAVDITLVGIQTAEVPFIGAGAMFNVTEGYLLKDYDESTDRLVVDIHGNVTASSYSFSIKLGVVGSVTINTADYLLPLTSNLTVNVKSGNLQISQDIAMLPDAVLNIAEGAKCTLINNSSLVVYDLDNWGNYCGSGNQQLVALPNAPGRTCSIRTSLKNDATLKINGTLDATDGYVYTTDKGANVYSDGSGKIIVGEVGTQESTYQVTQDANKNTHPVAITITSTKLKNADGTYTETKDSAGTYKYAEGKWVSDSCAGGHKLTATAAKDATCTTPGNKAYWTCSECKKVFSDEQGTVETTVEEQTIAVIAHTYDKEVAEQDYLKTAATCTAAAVYYKSCVCGAKGEDTFNYGDPVAHTYDKEVAKQDCLKTAATCTAAAVYYKSCVCGAKGEDTFNYGDPIAHTYDKEVAAQDYLKTAATCTAAAVYHKSCVCGAKGEDTFNYGDPIAHAYDKEVAEQDYLKTAATCTAAAVYHKSCVCGAKGEDTFNYGDPAGHTPGAEATCTTAQICTVCGTELEAQLGHTESSPVVENASDATCGASGSYEEVIYCSVCNFELSREHKTVDALPHTEETIPGKAATCTETGLTEGKKCSVCGEVLVEQEEIPVADHTEETIPGKDATCTETGLTEGKKCSVCDEVLVKQEVVPALDHDIVIDEAKAPTCTETGLTEGSHCTRCDDATVEQEVVPAIGHKYDNNADAVCNNCDYERDLSCEHTFIVDGCDEIYSWKQCSKCDAIDENSKEVRKYIVIFKGFEGGNDIQLQGTYSFEDMIIVPELKSFYFEFDGAWTVDEQVLTPQSEISLSVLKSLINDSDTIVVKGNYVISGLKSDAVLMSLQYGNTSGVENENIFMTISLFVNVDKDMTPIVSIDADIVEGEKFGTLDAYYYRIPLYMDQILDDDFELTVEVSYVGSSFSQQLTISIAEYIRALTGMFDDVTVAGTEELIGATRDYIEAFQLYKNKDTTKLPEKAPMFSVESADLDAPEFGEATMNGDKPVAKINGARAIMGEASYALDYRFVMNLPSGMILDSAQIILTDNVNALKKNEKWDESTGTAYGYETVNGEHVVSIKNVPASEMAVKYATVYLVYHDANGNGYFAYSTTLRYGVTTYLNRQIAEIQSAEDYQNPENKENWLIVTMFDKLRTLAGMADSSSVDEPTDTPTTEDQSDEDLTI